MQNSKWRTAFLLSGAALMLQSCGDGANKATDANFKSVLNAYYANHKDCVGLPTTKNDDGYSYIVEIADDSKPLGAQRNDRDLKPFLALVNAGVMTVEDTESTKKVFSRTEKVPGKGFKLTDLGKSMLLADEYKRGFSEGEPQLCYGHRIVDEITNFTEPADIRGVTVSSVNYTFKIGVVADWAKMPDVYLRYPHIETYIAKTSEDTDDLVLSDTGWVHHSVFNK